MELKEEIKAILESCNEEVVMNDGGVYDRVNIEEAIEKIIVYVAIVGCNIGTDRRAFNPFRNHLMTSSDYAEAGLRINEICSLTNRTL